MDSKACPVCGKVAHVKKGYYRCKNRLCSACFWSPDDDVHIGRGKGFRCYQCQKQTLHVLVDGLEGVFAERVIPVKIARCSTCGIVVIVPQGFPDQRPETTRRI